MRPQMIEQTIIELHEANVHRAICIEGEPGGGKTSVVRQAAKKLDVPYLEIHTPTAQPEDFGVPWVSGDSDTYDFKIPEWFPVEGKAPERGILCFDDRNQGDASLQKVIANIIQARTLHGARMPKGWQIVSTGNAKNHGAGANKVLTHLRDRENRVQFDTHLDDYTSWALDNNTASEGIAFIRYRPGLLHAFDPQEDVSPTPRSWTEGVFDLLGKVSKDAEYELFAGAVGEGAAAEFMGFLRIFRKLPNPDSILMNPKSADVPDDPATLYAISGALSNRASNGNIDRLVQYLERLPREFSVLTMSCAVRRDEDLCNTNAFVKWSVEHQDVLF